MRFNYNDNTAPDTYSRIQLYSITRKYNRIEAYYRESQSNLGRKRQDIVLRLRNEGCDLYSLLDGLKEVSDRFCDVLKNHLFFRAY